MSAAAVEHPCDGKSALLKEAERLAEKLPGYRIEIIGGELTVTPPPDGPHGDALSDLFVTFASLHGTESRVIQGIGVRLPDGPDDFAVPDLAVVDADYRDHLTEEGCYDPVVFRLVLEVTSSNYGNDLKKKVAAYAIAQIPVYVVIDRKKDRIHVLTDPFANEYRCHRVHAPGQRVVLPDSLGAEITLDVEAILAVGRP
ncbi:Uma2 family endonuclease [Streptomyces hygroscopicus]|uniref:Uma2 family endonuclease n=1 Tax=Streptomyces hygroscopicus TaxID=1912 RepID=UPI001FCBC3C1|nr:Uma2 family endonuclease [Streptomyces hygroscopicus]BDH15150.1 membrane protein [Streptomyces hygroscopicus]